MLYDVALWRYFHYGAMPIIDECVQADSPLLAALALMQQHKLRFAAHVAVACPDGTTWRHDRLSLILDPSSPTTSQEVYE